MRKRIIALAVILTLACVAIGARIAYVNATDSNPITTETYQMSDWVDLGGCFASNKQSESTDAYSVKLVSAKLTSYNEYVREFDRQDCVQEGLDAQSVIDMEFEIRNDGGEDGGIFLLGWKLFPERRNMYYIWDADLLKINQPELEGTLGFAVAPGTTKTIHIPFTVNLDDRENLSEYKSDIKDTDFELVITNSPIRKVITFHL